MRDDRGKRRKDSYGRQHLMGLKEYYCYLPFRITGVLAKEWCNADQ